MKADIAIVTGGREYTLTQDDLRWLGQMRQRYGFRIVLHGGARGADAGAAAWARSLGLCDAECPAEWKKLGKPAGHERNARMAWACENMNAVCLAFPGGTGTASMVSHAKAHEVEVRESPSRKEQA